MEETWLKNVNPWLRLVIIALVYFLTARLGLLVMFKETNITPVWPPTGVALASVLLFGFRAWPGIYLGAFFANLVTFLNSDLPTMNSLLMSMSIGVGNTLEAIVGIYLLPKKRKKLFPFSQARDVFRFILYTSIAAPLISATIGVLTVNMGGLLKQGEELYVWLTWWTGDITGALLFTPLIIAWLRKERFVIKPKKLAELFSLISLLILISLASFFTDQLYDEKRFFGLQYLPIPIILWISFRFKIRTSTASLFVLNIIAILGVVTKTGINSTTNLLLLQLYLSIVSIVTITLISLLEEQRETNIELRKTKLDLTEQVKELQKAKKEVMESNESLEKSRKAALSIMQDVTIQKQKLKDVLVELETSNKNLEQAKEEAESSNKAKSLFLTSMSHEIRTPMNSILGFTQILLKRESDLKKHHFLQSIQRSGETLLSLIDDVLDLAQIEAGKVELYPTAVSIHALLNKMETLFSRKIIDKGLNFTVEIDPIFFQGVLLDEKCLCQAIINLIGNAVKFTQSGCINILASGDREDEKSNKIQLIIQVKDTGIGIPKDKISKIFEAFEQIVNQQTKSVGGTGLGLTIAKKLVEMMGGSINVESELNIGSTFTIKIPNIEMSGPQVAPKVRNEIDYSKVSFEPATLLIADDLAYNRDLLTVYLDSWNFRYIFAENGKEVFQILEKESPNIILLDMKMPVLDGYEVTKKLKEDERFKDIPIVAVTASALLQDEEKINKICDGYLRKPVNGSDLVQELMRYLPHKIL